MASLFSRSRAELYKRTCQPRQNSSYAYQEHSTPEMLLLLSGFLCLLEVCKTFDRRLVSVDQNLSNDPLPF